MRARLFCKTGRLSGSDYPVRREATIGRAKGNTIVLPTMLVSKKHSRIFFDDETKDYWLEDLKSRNGSKLDGLPVTAPTRLGALHVVTFARDHDFIFQRLPDDVPLEPGAAAVRTQEPHPEAHAERGQPDAPKTVFEPEPMVAALPHFAPGVGAPTPASSTPGTKLQIGPVLEVPSALARSPSTVETVVLPQTGKDPARVGPDVGQFSLEVKLANDVREVFRLKAGRNVIGRSPACDISVDDITLSREHAVVQVTGGTITVNDLESLNKTFLDGNPISVPTKLTPDAVLTLGYQVTAQLVSKPRSPMRR